MKLRIILSAITLFVGWLINSTYHAFYSPITGVATAQSLNEDSGTGYVTAKFIREGGVENLIVAVILLVLVFIWISPVINGFKPRKN